MRQALSLSLLGVCVVISCGARTQLSAPEAEEGPGNCPPCHDTAEGSACSKPAVCIESDGCSIGWCSESAGFQTNTCQQVGHVGVCLSPAGISPCVITGTAPTSTPHCVWPRVMGESCFATGAQGGQTCGQILCDPGCACLCDNFCWCASDP